jgi:hypothetical protein
MILQKILLEENDPGQLGAINYIVDQLRGQLSQQENILFRGRDSFSRR